MNRRSKSRAETPNWIHLDLKGVIPSVRQLKHWLSFFRECGFNGVLWEYEDRLPWQTWQGLHRPGYTIEQWREIWAHCRSLELLSVPLIQTHGHLEWLLQNGTFADWREAGHINELCPQQPDVLPRLKDWIDEVVSLHPDSPYICLGGDETWHLASCERCAEKAAGDPRGKQGVYLDHIGAVCDHAAAHGVRPML